MDALRRHLLMVALAALCVHLVSLQSVGGLSIRESLPALVLDDEPVTKSVAAAAPEAPTSEASPSQAPSESTSSIDKKAVEEPAKDKSTKLVPYETKLDPAESSGGFAAGNSPQEPAAAPTVTASDAASNKETATSQPAATVSADASESTTSLEKATEISKDINVLLATKNDAENDLSLQASASDSDALKPSVVVAAADPSKTDLDAPVDTNSKPSGDANDNRFHYALGSDKSAEEPKASESDVVAATTTTAAPSSTEKPHEKKKEEEEEEETPKPTQQASAAEGEKKPLEADGQVKPLAAAEGPKVEEKPKDETLAGKKVEYVEDITKSVVVEPAKVDKMASSSAEDELAAKKVEKADKEAAAPLPTSTTSTTTTSPTLAAKAAPETSVAEAPKSEKTDAKETPKAGPSEPTSTSVAAPAADPAKAPSEKPASVPSILAVAIGTALGAAVNPILSSKDKPTVAAAAAAAAAAPALPAASSTTAAPKAAPSSTRKSTTDKWDRWTPSSSTTSTPQPSSRRRPILPSIRRRFRPYHRFSPFPWSSGGGGVDSYTPLGNEPEFAPAEFPSSKAPQIPTLKPKRRTTSSTTESTATRSGAGAGEAPEDDEGSVSSSRRRGQGANRHRNHHHHHHRHRHDTPEAAQGTTTSSRRRHQTNANRNHGYDRDERPSVFANSEPSYSDSVYPSPPRPLSPPGFGLFNTGSSGSGFDLMNPFSGWLDDAPKPQRPHYSGLGPSQSGSRPPLTGSAGRPLGHKPVSGEGEYSEEHPHSPARGDGHNHGHNHGHNNGHNHGHNNDRRPESGGRDEYDPYHDHHHDCHDDYDHHHDEHHRDPYRPGREPHRDREPYRPVPSVVVVTGGGSGNGGNGDYDTYPPNSNGGRRPNGRPYSRNGQDSAGGSRNGSGSSESAEPSPGMYGSRAGERVGGGASPSVSSPNAGAEPRRIPSLFSPFDSLFSSLNEDLFSLRSSFMDSPLKPDPMHTFDTVISSPKITLPKQPAASAGESEEPLKAKRASSSSDEGGFENGKIDSGDTGGDLKSKLVDQTPQAPSISLRPEPKSIDIDRSPVEPRQISRRPCFFPEGSLLCLFMHKKAPILELFHRL